MQAASGSLPAITTIIPTRNEARNLPRVFSHLPTELHEVIVVDGHSVDDTLAAVRRLRADARIIVQDRWGKSNALACGLAAATGDIIVMLDADGSADPSEIPQLVSVLLNGADFAKGTRFPSHGADSSITGLRRIVNRALSALVNALFHTNYSDPCYGFSAFWRRHIPVLGLNEESSIRTAGNRLFQDDRFEVDTLINIRVARAGLTVREVVSYEYPQIHKVSNVDVLNDSLRILTSIAAERYRSRRPRTSAVAVLIVLLSADLMFARQPSGRNPGDSTL